MKINRLRIIGGAAVLAFGLTACGTSIPAARVDTSAPGAAATGSATPVRALSMDDVKTAVAERRSVRVHTTVTFSGGDAQLPGLETTVTTDATNDRFAFTSAPTEIAMGDTAADVIAVPGYEVRGQISSDQIDLYVRESGDASWTHVVADTSLRGELTEFSDPSQQLDGLLPSEIPGITMEPEGTVDYKGETMTRQVATIDLAELLGGLGEEFTLPGGESTGDASEFSGELEGMMDDLLSSDGLAEALPKGTIEMIIDGSDLPRKITAEMTTGPADATLSMRSETTIDPLGDSDTIEIPAADQIKRTVQVDSADDLADALGKPQAHGSEMFGGN